jgi:hypothetical protein
LAKRLYGYLADRVTGLPTAPFSIRTLPPVESEFIWQYDKRTGQFSDTALPISKVAQQREFYDEAIEGRLASELASKTIQYHDERQHLHAGRMDPAHAHCAGDVAGRSESDVRR